MESPLQRLGLVVVCLVLAVSLILLPSLVSANSGLQNSGADGFESSMSDSPNIVSRGLNGTLVGLTNMINGTADAVSSTANSISGAAGNAGALLLDGGGFIVGGITGGTAGIGHAAASGMSAVGRGLTGGAVAAVRFPGNVASGLVGSVLDNGVMRPADNDSIPQIDAAAKILAEEAIIPPLVPKTNPAASAAVTVKPQWPIHGRITTEFGANDMPYQRFHTGIDISDHNGSGNTKIYPFSAGRVLQVVHNRSGLGNHVIIDHGNGLTSVYGHMYSTSVIVGQEVTQATVLGTEGTTGASTGPHVHFEIKLGGKYVNPHKYIEGNP